MLALTIASAHHLYPLHFFNSMKPRIIGRREEISAFVQVDKKCEDFLTLIMHEGGLIKKQNKRKANDNPTTQSLGNTVNEKPTHGIPF